MRNSIYGHTTGPGVDMCFIYEHMCTLSLEIGNLKVHAPAFLDLDKYYVVLTTILLV